MGACGCGATGALADYYASVTNGYKVDRCGVVRSVRTPDNSGGETDALVEGDETPGFAAVYLCSVQPAQGQNEKGEGGGGIAAGLFDIAIALPCDVRPTDELVVVNDAEDTADFLERAEEEGMSFEVIATDAGRSRAIQLTARCRRVE